MSRALILLSVSLLAVLVAVSLLSNPVLSHRERHHHHGMKNARTNLRGEGSPRIRSQAEGVEMIKRMFEESEESSVAGTVMAGAAKVDATLPVGVPLAGFAGLNL